MAQETQGSCDTCQKGQELQAEACDHVAPQQERR